MKSGLSMTTPRKQKHITRGILLSIWLANHAIWNERFEFTTSRKNERINGISFHITLVCSHAIWIKGCQLTISIKLHTKLLALYYARAARIIRNSKSFLTSGLHARTKKCKLSSDPRAALAYRERPSDIWLLAKRMRAEQRQMSFDSCVVLPV